MTGHKFATRLSIFLVSCLCVAAPAHAEDDELPSIDVKFVQAPEMPKRELIIEESKEPIDVELFAADPKLLEQKFVATFTFQRPQLGRDDLYLVMGRKGDSAGLQELSTLLWVDLQDSKVAPRLSGSSIPPILITDWLRQLDKRTVGEHRPEKAILKQLLMTNRVRMKLKHESSRFGPYGGVGVRTGQPAPQTFHLIGPDFETTSAMALALIKLHDYGVTMKMQERLIADMKQRKAKLPELLAEFQVGRKKLKASSEKLKGFESIPLDVIADLQIKQRLVSVDIAGAQARISACEDILKRKEVRSPKNAEHVESMKITAEVELVGLTAQLEILGSIIESGRKRKLLSSSLSITRSAVSRIENRIESEIGRIDFLEASRIRFRPTPIVNNTIQIRPIKWRSAASKE